MQAAVFDDLVRALYFPLRSYIATKVPCDWVDDVLQDTLSSLWADKAEVPQNEFGHRRLRAKAYKVAARRAADHWRAHARHERKVHAAGLTRIEQTAPSALDEFLARTPPAWLYDLSTEALEVLLRFADGASVSQIAEELDISPNAVSSRLKRIRERMPQIRLESEHAND